VVVINKIDKVDAARRDEVAAVVKALNPVAEHRLCRPRPACR
jgi:G3E family GTPase